MPHQDNLVSQIRRYYRAYETKDRSAIEQLLAADFTFSSPRDDHIDRATYFSRCWPHSDRSRRFAILRIVEAGDTALVEYELHALTPGVPVRHNIERFRSDGCRIREVEVFFGRSWSSARDDA